MEEGFIKLTYFSLQLAGDMFVLYNTYENIIVRLRLWVNVGICVAVVVFAFLQDHNVFLIYTEPEKSL